MIIRLCIYLTSFIHNFNNNIDISHGIFHIKLFAFIVNNIIDYALGTEDECKFCQGWRDNQELIRYHLNLERKSNRNIGDEI